MKSHNLRKYVEDSTSNNIIFEEFGSLLLNFNKSFSTYLKSIGRFGDVKAEEQNVAIFRITVNGSSGSFLS